MVRFTVEDPFSVITGPVVSTTVTVLVVVPVFEDESVAVQVTTVVPNGNTLPEVWLQVDETVPSTLSIADTENVVVAPLGPVASTVCVFGLMVTTGAVVSGTESAAKVAAMV